MRFFQKSESRPQRQEPISLLASQGKWLEDLTVSHVWVDLERKGMVDSRQFVFTVGRGTEDAINCFIDEVRGSPCKYVMGVLFVDISGAYNRAQMLEEVEGATNDR